MIVAAGGGERDVAVDMAILNAYAKGNSGPGFLNERLMNDLRPTLFLAQLSNLLAGNIAIVHGVSGTSRTFMGEEAASIDAARIALARIASGQSDIALVGAAHNGERTDLLVLYEFGDFNLKGKFAPVWARDKTQRLCARLGGRFPGDRIQRACAGARRQALRQADQRGRRSRATQAARRGDQVAGSVVVEARQARRQRRPSSPARPAPNPSLRKKRPSCPGTPVARCARPGRCSGTRWRRNFRWALRWPRFRSRAARCFRPTIRPDWSLKCPTPPTQIVVVGAGHWQGEGMALVEAVG